MIDSKGRNAVIAHIERQQVVGGVNRQAARLIKRYVPSGSDLGLRRRARGNAAEHNDAIVAAIRYEDIVLRVDCDSLRTIEGPIKTQIQGGVSRICDQRTVSVVEDQNLV